MIKLLSFTWIFFRVVDCLCPFSFGVYLLSLSSCGFAYVLLHRSLITIEKVLADWLGYVSFLYIVTLNHHANSFFFLLSKMLSWLSSFFFASVVSLRFGFFFFVLLSSIQIWFQACFFLLAIRQCAFNIHKHIHSCTT